MLQVRRVPLLAQSARIAAARRHCSPKFISQPKRFVFLSEAKDPGRSPKRGDRIDTKILPQILRYAQEDKRLGWGG
jgi:hypothetical protein